MLSTHFMGHFPRGGVLLGIFGCAARISKSRPNFKPKNAIFHTRFQTWHQRTIPVFRPDLENIRPFLDIALESRYII